MQLLFRIFIIIIFLPTLTLSENMTKVDSEINKLWIDCSLTGVVPFDVFKSAIQGYRNIGNIRKKGILTIIDFTKPSTEKRFYVIDIENKKLIYRCLVAHGKNSGDIYAKDFSNKMESLKSSLGFYLTGETYKGDHGYSLRLDGLEKGINDNARAREIVIHGAEYVSEEFIRKYGRLGRSWGCPALPPDLSKEIIDKIADGSCLFIHADDKFYRENSTFLNKKN
jgi:hypothetical protein